MRSIGLAMTLMLCLLIEIRSQEYRVVSLDEPFSGNLTEETMFQGRYVFDIDDSKVKALNTKKWFFFVEL